MVEEDEIDLRPYVMTLLHHWKLIAGITVVAAVVAAAVSLATPTSYQATATVATAPAGAQPAPQAKPYIDLATSDKVVTPLAQELASGSGSASLSAADLKGKLRATGGAEARLVNLTVQDTDPNRAVKIASSWAPIFIQVTNSTLNSPVATIKDLEGQAKVASNQLRGAEDKLAVQEGRNSVVTLTTHLKADRQTLQQLYADRTALQSAGEEVGALKSKLGQLDPASPATPSDELAALRIGAQIVGSNVQLQLPSPSTAAGRTVGAQLAYLDSLNSLIKDRSAEIDKQITAAQATVLDAQNKLQLAKDEQAPLLATRDNLRKTIADLDQKANQLRVATAAGTSQAHLADSSPVQATPLPRGTTKNVALAILLGLMVGVAAAFGTEYLGSRRHVSTPELQPSK